MVLEVDNYKLEYEGNKLYLPLTDLLKNEPHQTEPYHPQGIYIRNKMVRKITDRTDLDQAGKDSLLRKLDKRVFTYDHFRTDTGERMELRPYQVGLANTWAPNIANQSSRSVGKSTLIEVEALWGAEVFPGFQTLIATQGESQLYPIMERIIYRINNDPYLKSQLAKKPVRNPKYHIVFKNGHQIWGSIAGPDGTNFNGLHVHRILVDESQIMTKKAWTELWRCRNMGSLTSIRIMGVPNGLRDRKFFDLTNDRKHWEWFHFTQCMLPESNFNEVISGAKEYSDIGYPDFNNPDFLQQFLGLHAVPSRTGIDFDAYLKTIKEYAFYQIIDIPRSVFPEIITEDPEPIARSFMDFAGDQVKEIDHFIKDEGVSKIFAGADLGYASDPTEVVLFYEDPANNNKLTAMCRFHFERIDYPIQCALLEFLFNRYPIVRMGIDLGNNGLAVHQFMMAKSSKYSERLRGFFANQKILVGYTADDHEQIRQMKEFTTSKINSLCISDSITYKRDKFRTDQYSNVVYRITSAGNTVFPKGNDHILDADRCMVAAWHLYRERLEEGGGEGALDQNFIASLKTKSHLSNNPSGSKIAGVGILPSV